MRAGGNISRYAPMRSSAPKNSAPDGHIALVARVSGPRRCTVVMPLIRAKAIIGLTFAIDLKSVWPSHAADQMRTNRLLGPETASKLSPTPVTQPRARSRGERIDTMSVVRDRWVLEAE